MTLKEKIQWLETRPRFKPKTTLDHLKEVFNTLDLSLPSLKVHVVGTNGKGSTTMMTTHILKKKYRVGSFISPYVYTFNERILIDGDPVSDDILEKALDDIILLYETYPTLTFFELLTLMALMIFSKESCDAIVMEAGIGGRLDATNILDYTYSLIVSVGHDHLHLLGPTLEDVLKEKISIIKPNGHLLSTVDPKFNDVIKAHVHHIKHAKVSFLDDHPFQITTRYPLSFNYKDTHYKLSFLGDHYASNARLAIDVGIHENISTEDIKEALIHTTMPGRFEKILDDVYVDGAHNQEAMACLSRTLNHVFPHDKKIIILSVLGDKDIKQMLEILKQDKHTIILTSFEDPRYQDISQYQTDDIVFIKDAMEAYKFVTVKKDEQTKIIITGSIHFIGYLGSKIKQTL
jgi:dihydrofolate synthase/folylpolyglutamate synthase